MAARWRIPPDSCGRLGPLEPVQPDEVDQLLDLRRGPAGWRASLRARAMFDVTDAPRQQRGVLEGDGDLAGAAQVAPGRRRRS